MASQFGKNDWIVQTVFGVGEDRYEIVLKHGLRQYRFQVRAVEYPSGIRAVEETESLFRLLSEAARLDAAKLLFGLVWRIRQGVRVDFPLMLAENAVPNVT